MNANGLTPSEHRDYARELYAVEGVRVTLDMYRGWQCTCAAYLEQHDCPHLAQAQAFRRMRGAKRDDDTIELQCSPAELQALSRAEKEREEEEHTEIARVPSPAGAGRERRRSSWTTVGAAAALAAVSSGVTYLAASWAHGDKSEQRLSQVLLAPVPTPAASLPDEPVRFVNPFDSNEVFLFPAGTSHSAARDAVADFLLERARERAARTEAVAQTG